MAKAARKTGKSKRSHGKRESTAPVETESITTIQTWSTDPRGSLPPIQVPAPALPGVELPTQIIDPAAAPPPQIYSTGTAEFRFWTAAEALRRTAGFWSTADGTHWNPSIAGPLPVRLDDGVDLNAYYARDDYPPADIKQGLSFFHDTVRDDVDGRRTTVYSGESPDVVAHEAGHAVLDGLKPALWAVATTEAAAFHESFGDMSAILTALQLPTVRQAVLEETDGRLWRNSSVSRIAEQLGFAIRQRSPSAVDPDSLRNASNSFVYVDPTTLPASGPAASLTRSPHNFSRVFTGAFLEALGGMVLAVADPPRSDDVLEASHDMRRLLIRAIRNAPVRTHFFQAVAEQLLLADSQLFNGRYAEPLTTALVRRGLLPIRSLSAPAVTEAATSAEGAAAAARVAATSAGGVTAGGAATPAAESSTMVALDGTALGLSVTTLYAEAPAVDDGGTISPGRNIAESGYHGRYDAVQAFVEELILRGRVTADPRLSRPAGLMRAITHKRLTHQLVRVEDRVELRRLTFDCGC